MKFGKCHYRPQVDQMDCGVASLAMVFGYYGSYYSLAHLRELAKTTMDGTTALGLVKVAEEIGFETRAIKADMTLFDLPDLTFPFVAHVLKEGKLLHYYVVTGQDKDSIHIADPDPGVKLTKLSPISSSPSSSITASPVSTTVSKKAAATPSASM